MELLFIVQFCIFTTVGCLLSIAKVEIYAERWGYCHCSTPGEFRSAGGGIFFKLQFLKIFGEKIRQLFV